MKSGLILLLFLEFLCLTTSLKCFECQKDGDGKCHDQKDLGKEKECSEKSLCFRVKHEHHKDTHCKCIY